MKSVGCQTAPTPDICQVPSCVRPQTQEPVGSPRTALPPSSPATAIAEEPGTSMHSFDESSSHTDDGAPHHASELSSDSSTPPKEAPPTSPQQPRRRPTLTPPPPHSLLATAAPNAAESSSWFSTLRCPQAGFTLSKLKNTLGQEYVHTEAVQLHFPPSSSSPSMTSTIPNDALDDYMYITVRFDVASDVLCWTKPAHDVSFPPPCRSSGGDSAVPKPPLLQLEHAFSFSASSPQASCQQK